MVHLLAEILTENVAGVSVPVPILTVGVTVGIVVVGIFYLPLPLTPIYLCS